MRQGGDSYYVLVDTNGDVYETEDYIDTYVAEFDTWEDAEEELDMLIADEVLDEKDGWHVERHRW